MGFGDALRSYWPLIVTIGGGLMAFGALSSNVGQLRESHAEVKLEVDKQRILNAADHDLLVKLNSKQEQTTDALSELKIEVKELTKLLRRPSVWDRMTGRDQPADRAPDQR